ATTSAIWQLELEYADGRTDSIRSGTDARSSSGPWRYADLFVGECFDRRRLPAGWQRPGFDDADWAPVQANGTMVAVD
ncbi:alpha-L-rhamnosidase N-terminal domain-containing protein, partial [Rhizobium johnstonii]|uniref:alpha-L-rhamnosidase N-terminal domain-containing protein n=1 Tax=Rhizobium johnstonii TaxID=3019933 RepID=UPI003F97D6F3